MKSSHKQIIYSQNLKIQNTISKKRLPLRQTFQSITSLDITLFFRQLVTLISAGIPIVQGCDILAHGQENASFKIIIQAIKNELEAGKNLMNALKKFPQYFDDLTCQLIHAGEQSGSLETILLRIAHYKEKSLRLKNQILQALFYPTLTFIVAITVTLIMLTWVVPRFQELFETMHGHLPAFTLFIIRISQILREKLWIMIVPVLFTLLFFYLFKTHQNFKHSIDHVLLKIPLANKLLKKILLARFARTLATTFASGVPIIAALKITAATCGNNTFIKSILTLQIKIATGQQLHLAMSQDPIFPKMTIQMIKVGEESGSLETMLEKIAEIYESDIDHFVAHISRLLEPLIMVILGALIGGLVIAMYLPIFKLGTVI
jgi:type IV pilus assembly protein PilC